MKVSYKWLNEYFDKELPSVGEVAEILTMNSSEVEGIESIGDDIFLDIKILPNMAHFCLCHRGIARELSVLLNLPMKKYAREFPGPEFKKKVDIRKIESSHLNLKIEIEDKAGCRRYIGRVLQNIKITSSPKWLKEHLETIGQKSINNLVDATNYVMFELGQPLHVFDADKIIGDLIKIKKAKTSDEIITLDNKKVILDDNILTISNNNNALAIAGIKGGTLAEISAETKNIVLESANFDPVLIRKTAQRLKLQTEASKRYENELTPELADEAMDLLTNLIVDIAGTEDTKIGRKVDVYPKVFPKRKLTINSVQVEKVLGLKITIEEIQDIFKRFDFKFSQKDGEFMVEIPVERLDLLLKEDLIEEIGRVYGYDKLTDSGVNNGDSIKAVINKDFYYTNKIRQILTNQGFSEIYGYSFRESGEIELANSVAPEKKFLRENLASGLTEYLEFNARYADLIFMPQIKIFEIGRIFKINDEHISVAIGIHNVKKPKEFITNLISILEESLKIKLSSNIFINDNIIEFNFTDLISKLAEPEAYDIDLPLADKNMRYKSISIYPFSVRDVAVFTPAGTTKEEVFDLIKSEAGELLMNSRLFDVFEKKMPDGQVKISYAFRLIFQSYTKTLTEEEISGSMKRITDKLNSQIDWQVR